jgi:pimeloyl-ACP methyl ester carboxylesterase
MNTLSSPVTSPSFGGKIAQFSWSWRQQNYTIAYETLGQGRPILLLPAFSTVSSRSEMGKIAQLLATQFQVYALDWLGFGASQRPSLDYQPLIFQQLLEDFVASIFHEPIVLIAAGHSAGYAIQLVKQHADRVTKLILVAPTWLGPLRAMGLPQAVRDAVREMVRSPILGQLLYQLNTTPWFLRLMYSRHVYRDAHKLTPEFIAQKRQITQQTGARYAPAAFVTGRLDPTSNQAEFLANLAALSHPILIIVAEDAPPKSQAEMEIMTSLPNIESVRLSGTLGIHEENPESVTEAIYHFLAN